MSTILVVCFLVIFALLLGSIGFGLRFYESRRRKQLVSMLRTVTENGEERHVNLLLDPGEKRPGAEDLLESLNFTERIEKMISESGLDWTPSKLYTLSGMACAAGLVLGFLVPAPLSPFARVPLAGLIVGLFPFLKLRRTRSKRLDALEKQLPDALDFLARSMRAGHAFTVSLEMVGEEIHEPLGQEFRALFNEQNLGASLERCLNSFARRVPLPDVRFFSSAVLLQRQTGGNLSEILNRLSHIIRERFRLKGQVKAVSAHGRLTATILTLLPIATLGGLMLTSPGYLEPLFHDPTGKKMVAGGIVAQILGNICIQKIIKIKV